MNAFNIYRCHRGHSVTHSPTMKQNCHSVKSAEQGSLILNTAVSKVTKQWYTTEIGTNLELHFEKS